MANSATLPPVGDVSATGWQVAESKGPTALDNPLANANASVASEGTRAPKTGAGDVGTALRNAFRATVEEDIPSEMLDLLRRLD
jgi:hypothetical protein